MMLWVKLTTTEGRERWVNMDAVNEMWRGAHEDGTPITRLMFPHEDWTDVTETPEQILQLMRDAADEA